jgi:16S rRNA (uracil1498-N3)-methyltransferase
MHRFYLPELPHEGALVALSDEEARHLTQVLRLALGDEIHVFDGHGREHAARVEVAKKQRAEVRIGRAAPAAPEPGVRITLASAILKGDKFDDVVRDATMAGAHAIQPLVTARTEVPAARAGSTARVDRWRRVALSSTKQCGRAVLPAILEPRTLSDAVRTLPPPLIVLAEPSTDTAAGALPPPPIVASVLVGPEGGWAPAEIDLLQREHATFVRLGGRTLRADAAPLVALSVLLYAWKAL